MGVPMATIAKGGHWITLSLSLSCLSLSLVSLSRSVSRVIKDCTLINFSALSRAKCPGRGLCVCILWLCVCAHVSVCMRPCACSRLCYVCVLGSWIHSCQPFSSFHICVRVSMIAQIQHNISFNFLLQTVSSFIPLHFSLLIHAPSSSLTASKAAQMLKHTPYTGLYLNWLQMSYRPFHGSCLVSVVNFKNVKMSCQELCS